MGKKPPCAQRLLEVHRSAGPEPEDEEGGQGQEDHDGATLIPANQYSNSPKEETENRLVAVIATIRMSESSQSGESTQYWSTYAPATASKPTTITQKYQ